MRSKRKTFFRIIDCLVKKATYTYSILSALLKSKILYSMC